MLRYRRLLLGLLVVSAVFGVGQFAWSVGRAELRSRALRGQFEAGPGAVVDFARLGPSDWERVYIFHPYYPHSSIGPALGCHWEYAEGGVGEGMNLVVFVRHGEVVGWFEHPRYRGDLVTVASESGYSRDQAQFVVALDQWQRLVLVPR